MIIVLGIMTIKKIRNKFIYVIYSAFCIVITFNSCTLKNLSSTKRVNKDCLKLAYSINDKGTAYVELNDNEKELDLWTGAPLRKIHSIQLDSITLGNKYYGIARFQEGFAITSQAKNKIYLVLYSWKGKKKDSITLYIPNMYIAGRPSFEGVQIKKDTVVLSTESRNSYFFYKSNFVKMKAYSVLDTKKDKLYYKDSIFKENSWIKKHLGEPKYWFVYDGSVYAQNKKGQKFIYHLKDKTIEKLNHKFVSSIKFKNGEVFCSGDSIHIVVFPPIPKKTSKILKSRT